LQDVTGGDTYFVPGLSWYWNFNEYGEPLGRYFGANGGVANNFYTISKERRQIQLDESFSANSIVLMYISDGQSVDAATQIDVQAFYSIQSWIAWKSSPNAQNNFSPEGKYFLNEKRKLKAKAAGLTLDEIKNTIRSNYHAGLKN